MLFRERMPAGGRVVDVGCGRGAFALRLADAGFEVVGLDVDPPREHESQRYGYEQVDLFSDEARARFLERHAHEFDAAALLEVIEHVHDPWEALEFCHALLKPGGILVLSTPNITSFFSRFRFLTGGRFHQFEPTDFAYGHINPMTAQMVAKVLDDTGFEVIEKRPGPPVPIVVWASAIRSVPARVLHMASFLVAGLLTIVMRGGDLDGWSLLFVARPRDGASGRR